VVALQLPNVPHFLTAYFGALKAGMVVLPLNPLLMRPSSNTTWATRRPSC
jgi:long-chain acyl-CoA synthetase